jgi:malate synthase
VFPGHLTVGEVVENEQAYNYCSSNSSNMNGHGGQGVEIRGKLKPEYKQVLTPEAVEFTAHLVRKFGPRVDQLLQRRKDVQARYDAGEKPDFLPETKRIRESDWKVAPLPEDLLDRRVEITGPVDRKMVINALNSGASVYMADFEDSNAPTWTNQLDGLYNMQDASRGKMSFKDPKSGKNYELGQKTATLMVRARGWHLPEKHFIVDGRVAPGAIFDFAFHFFHNAKVLLERGTGPYFYLPKMQSHLEARLWNDIFCDAQDMLGIPRGTIKATVLIETLPAAFEMDEILFELREHSAGLNCGRWDYIFSMIKTLKEDPKCVFPDRNTVGMTAHALRSYSLLVIRTCHKRGVHAMGGMAAQIPIKNDDRANAAALEKVKGDKLREVKDGHDGTWVAHPALVKVAMDIFNEHMPKKNQIDKKREDVNVTRQDLLQIPDGPRTEAALRNNISVGVQYLEAWLGGLGCVPLFNMMEDAATAEIGRTQVWQWLHHKATLDGGEPLTVKHFNQVLDEEMAKLRDEKGADRFYGGHFEEARGLFARFSTSPELADFLTLGAYDYIVEPAPKQQRSRL